jgi:hypothetical protein
MARLDRAIQGARNNCILLRLWMAGSSPAMTFGGVSVANRTAELADRGWRRRYFFAVAVVVPSVDLSSDVLGAVLSDVTLGTC